MTPYFAQPISGLETGQGPLGTDAYLRRTATLYGIIKANPGLTSSTGLPAYAWQQLAFTNGLDYSADDTGLASASGWTPPATCRLTGYAYDLSKRTDLPVGTIIKVSAAYTYLDSTGYQAWLIGQDGSIDLLTALCANTSRIPGYNPYVVQLLGHTVNGCLHWFDTSSCASGSGSGSGGGAGHITACCPGVSIPSTLYMSGSNGENGVLYYTAGTWNGDSTLTNSWQLSCTASTWFLGGNGTACSTSIAADASSSCTPFSLVFKCPASGPTYTVTE